MTDHYYAELIDTHVEINNAEAYQVHISPCANQPKSILVGASASRTAQHTPTLISPVPCCASLCPLGALAGMASLWQSRAGAPQSVRLGVCRSLVVCHSRDVRSSRSG